jgi:hypothetical protein
LTNPDLEHVRNWYGVRGSNDVALSTDSKVPWPVKYSPHVAGYKFEYLDPQRKRDPAGSRKLGITILHFVYPPPAEVPKVDVYGGRPIALTVFNIGGYENWEAPTGGGALVYYSIKREDGKLSVEYEGSERP